MKNFNENKFINTLKAVDAMQSPETLAAMLDFAVQKKVEAKDGNYLDALISVAKRAGWWPKMVLALRAAGVQQWATVTAAEKPVTFKGITIDHQLKPKARTEVDGRKLSGKEVKAEFEAALAMVDGSTLLEAFTAEVLAEQAEKKAKKEERAREKATRAYWEKRLEKLASEAAKHGFEVTGNVKALLEQVTKSA